MDEELENEPLAALCRLVETCKEIKRARDENDTEYILFLIDRIGKKIERVEKAFGIEGFTVVA